MRVPFENRLLDDEGDLIDELGSDDPVCGGVVDRLKYDVIKYMMTARKTNPFNNDQNLEPCCCCCSP